MAKIQVLAGDFLQGAGEYCNGIIKIETQLYPWPGIEIATATIKSVEVATTDSGVSVGRSLRHGVAAGLAMGPMAAMAGLVLGNEEQEVTFVMTLHDGRQLLVAASEKVFMEIVPRVGRGHPA